MQMPRSDAPDYESIRDADNVMVANLALGIKAVASDPAAFRYLRGNAIFRFPVVRSPLLPMFADVAREAGCEPVLRIVEMLSCSNHTLHGRLALSEALRKLSGDRTELGVDLSVKLANERRPSAAEPDDSDARREEYLLNRTQASVVLLLGRAGLRIVDLRPQGRSVGLWIVPGMKRFHCVTSGRAISWRGAPRSCATVVTG